MSSWFRRLLGWGQSRPPNLLSVLRQVAFGDEAAVEREAAAWARRRADDERGRQEREEYERAAQELRERVMRNGGSYFPGVDD